jgi:hypothetical protein
MAAADEANAARLAKAEAKRIADENAYYTETVSGGKTQAQLDALKNARATAAIIRDTSTTMTSRVDPVTGKVITKPKGTAGFGRAVAVAVAVAVMAVLKQKYTQQVMELHLQMHRLIRPIKHLLILKQLLQQQLHKKQHVLPKKSAVKDNLPIHYYCQSLNVMVWAL